MEPRPLKSLGNSKFIKKHGHKIFFLLKIPKLALPGVMIGTNRASISRKEEKAARQAEQYLILLKVVSMRYVGIWTGVVGR